MKLGFGGKKSGMKKDTVIQKFLNGLFLLKIQKIPPKKLNFGFGVVILYFLGGKNVGSFFNFLDGFLFFC